MRGIPESRRGSALLIVLGMFSFMLVSAVSFSIYMRASRAPSSYLRRNAAVRQLVKAAVARAMDELDCAIGNDPFPGVGYNHDYGNDGTAAKSSRKNDNWHGHVFTPSNEVAHADTVSTLTLEALGYLPPCLIDEVRYWSRHTRTAKWHSFNYGLGQYAFTAVNVSDMFDINQLIDEPGGVRKPYLNRNSAPHGRVSPTYLFRSGENADMDTGGSLASAFISAIADGSGIGGSPSVSEVPFVSMMDFNLAMGSRSPGGILSPFMSRLNGSTGRFYPSENAVRPQVFMAGGWNGGSNLTYSAYSSLDRVNLRYPEFQPFSGCSWFPEATTLAHCYNDVSESHPYWRLFDLKCFPIISSALLCDYLDYDSVPLSLCIPCVEAVPMLCGVELNDGCVVCDTAYSQGPISSVTTPGGTTQTRVDTCSIQVRVDFNPTITVAYPFLYDGQGAGSFEIECYARIFFEEEQSSSDSSINDSGLRSGFFNLGSIDGSWGSLNTGAGGTSFIEVKCSTPLRVGDFSGSRGANNERNATVSKTLRATMPPVTKNLAQLTFRNTGSGWTFQSAADATAVDFFPRGNLDAASRVNFGTTFGNTGGTSAFRPMVAMWVRIKDSAGKTVDMSPAVPAYDSSNGVSGNEALNGFNKATTGDPGASYPAFRFFPKKAAAGIVPDRTVGGPFDGANSAPAPVTVNTDWKQKAYIANDPRINWAPEQWWATDGSTDPRDLWISNVQNFRGGDPLRDQDIFMSVSDQGYQQSVYEWMMIPQVRDLGVSDANAEWGVFQDGAGYNGVIRTAVGDVLHKNVMWRTYRTNAFGYNSDWGRLDDLPFEEADNGLRVNPYTDVTNVMLGAFANMPRDWWAAGTNHLAAGKGYMNGMSFDRNYLFDWSCTYRDVYEVTKFWMSVFRERNAEDLYCSTGIPDRWTERFDGNEGGSLVQTPDSRGRPRWEYQGGTSLFSWNTGAVSWKTSGNYGQTFEDIMQDLTFAERKYLYGYLKGCFANPSQLFLVFVRAESAAGGGGAGSGARAVALVWRDPAAPSNGGLSLSEVGRDNAQQYLHTSSGSSEESWRLNERKYPPHRMRILFYHQFD